jgi:membrane protein DedA with SNARE-associated domain
VEHFLHQNGYLTVFITIVFTGEFGLFAGVALAHRGVVTITGVIFLGTLASFVGNMFYYYAGRFLWGRWHFLKKNFGPKIDSTSPAVHRYGSPLMLISRFFYGIRNIVPITLGIYNVGVYIFAVYNLVGAFIWAWTFTEGGAFVSSHLVKRFMSFRFGLFWGLVASAVLVLLYLGVRKAVSKL